MVVKLHFKDVMGVKDTITVRQREDSEWEARIVIDGDVRATARGPNCPDAIGALHYQLERDGRT